MEEPGASLVPQVGAPAAPVPRIASTDDWQDLIAQRPSAVLVRHGALVVDLSREQARKHLALTQPRAWRLGEDVEGRRAAVVVGRGAAIDIPLDGALSPALNPEVDGHAGLALAIELRALAERQSMTVVVNDQPLAHLRVGPGWERRTLSLPAAALRPGDNRVRLHFRRTAARADAEVSAAIARIEAATHERIVSPPADDELEPVRVHPRADGRAELELRAGTALAYYVVPPRRGRLAIEARGKGSLAVRLSSGDDHAAGRAQTVLLEEPLRETGERHELDLTAWGDMPVRLELAVRGSEEDSHAILSAATLIARRSVPVDSRARTLRDVIVIAIEGARADAFEIGLAPPLPNLEAFRAESLWFERAHALSPVALPSHAGWLASVVPPVHLTRRGTYIADAQSLLPEALARGGYFRTLVTANTHLRAERGFTQGFDVIEALDETITDDHARAIAATARRELDDRSGRWFATVNLDDPLAPYEPPRELLGELEVPPDGPIPHLSHVWVGRVRLGKTVPTPRVLSYVQRLYRGELQMCDEAVGAVLELLREQGRLDEAIVVLVGVHGQEFYEHGGAGDSTALWEESLRVPLAIRAPQLLAPGAVSVPVDLLDLAPTIADLVGVPAPETWQGRSLVPVIDDPQPPPRLVMAYLGDGSRVGLVGDHKLVIGPGLAERFYDLGADPVESTDVLATGGVALRIVRTALAWQLGHESRWRRARWGTGADLQPAFALDLGM
jgi:arylsulfatase A-like enzyme